MDKHLTVGGSAEELRALSREIHDEVAHAMLTVVTWLELAEMSGEVRGSTALKSLSFARQAAADALERLRHVAARLRTRAEHERHSRHDLPLYDDRAPGRNGAEGMRGRAVGETDVYEQLRLVLREAVQNAVVHARARRITVDVRLEGEMIRAVVEDDGEGFEPRRLPPAEGLGLASMSERVANVGGDFEIASCHCRGTRIAIGVPQRRASDECGR
ncbi:hypothetical protein GCM10010116_06310 [Microbispora rosea subsp. aerata]|nr:ATP-binding protein [Microbispora rosea]GGO03202.1 hypothetical protein GCM10010116_06310 [Microbispora rosea subsp. aerata]GIH54468.1 hypothetical protein Mro02_13820 [Microbispora rosea subsp. aerata]GLJ82734.1 hypothetical protein GCM10017588_14600 [Microbispora rosea subsp. aerata]